LARKNPHGPFRKIGKRGLHERKLLGSFRRKRRAQTGRIVGMDGKKVRCQRQKLWEGGSERRGFLGRPECNRGKKNNGDREDVDYVFLPQGKAS